MLGNQQRDGLDRGGAREQAGRRKARLPDQVYVEEGEIKERFEHPEAATKSFKIAVAYSEVPLGGGPTASQAGEGGQAEESEGSVEEIDGTLTIEALDLRHFYGLVGLEALGNGA